MKQNSRRSALTCSKGFLLILAALIYLDGAKFVFQFLLASALHEAGHWLAIRCMGGRVCALRLSAVGAEMELDQRRALSYGRETAAALAGPAMNLLAAGCAIWREWYLFAGINLCLGVLNLIPASPLDGERALTNFLYACGLDCADRISNGISVAFSGGFLGLGWAAWRKTGNLSLLIAALWLVAGTIKSDFR